ncbi:MAG: hypothetical protein MJZ69_05365 [Bacteroidaceae bacterium]|nr:hypothetical protein [Candidatus Minthousia equi]MCQ2246201.1 hypothetical protein [Bacteroidaceae bacterium]MDO4955576.1 hypothetical protein [Bacteroidales bacterium]
MKENKLSYYALIVCFILTAVVFGLFFFVGYDQEENGYVAPQFTETLIFLMYIMAAVAGVLTLISFFKGVALGGAAMIKRVALVWGMAAVAVVIGFALSSDAPVTLADGTQVASRISDVMIIAIYILSAVALLGLIASLTGILKK